MKNKDEGLRRSHKADGIRRRACKTSVLRDDIERQAYKISKVEGNAIQLAVIYALEIGKAAFAQLDPEAFLTLCGQGLDAPTACPGTRRAPRAAKKSPRGTEGAVEISSRFDKGRRHRRSCITDGTSPLTPLSVIKRIQGFQSPEVRPPYEKEYRLEFLLVIGE